MRTFLDKEELFKAIVCYMALKGFEIKDEYVIETTNKGGFKGFHIEVLKSSNYKLETIKKYANNNY